MLNYKRFSITVEISLVSLISYGFAVLLSKFFTGEPVEIVSLWILLSAIIVLQDSVESTIDAMLLRLFGTAIGASLGVASYYVFGQSLLAIVSSIFLTSLFCVFLGLEKHMRLACVTVAVVLLIFGLSPIDKIWVFAIWRFIDSAIGSFIALLVMHVFHYLNLSES